MQTGRNDHYAQFNLEEHENGKPVAASESIVGGLLQWKVEEQKLEDS
jgi:hypothetical protein